jgi:sugar phosphate isomerase/epimerase
MNHNWSFQLYSARNFQPWDKVLGKLAEIGYAEVEGFGGVYADPAGLAKMLKNAGLTMPSGHFGLDPLEKELAKSLDTAKTLGMRMIICPSLAASDRPKDRDGWLQFGERLAAIGKKVKAAGYEFGWHNHAFEFEKLPDGSVPMQAILDAAPDLSWEADIAWIVRGGGEPFDWIKRYDARISAVHVKDIAPAGKNADEDGWADIGHGTLPWAKLIAELRKSGKTRLFIMEHDNPKDFERFASRSLAAAKRY